MVLLLFLNIILVLHQGTVTICVIFLLYLKFSYRMRYFLKLINSAHSRHLNQLYIKGEFSACLRPLKSTISSTIQCKSVQYVWCSGCQISWIWQDLSCPPCRQTINLGLNMQEKALKTCYPLLRGTLNIMMKDGLSLAFFCNSERITHCFFWWEDIHVYFSIHWIFHFHWSGPRGVRLLPQQSKAWDMWVITLFVLLLIMSGIED